MGDLDASRSLLLVGVGFGDGFTDNLKSSRLGHGGGGLVASITTGNADESLFLLVGNDLEQVLEGVLGVLVVDFVNGGGLLVQGLDDSLLASDGAGEDNSVLDGTSLNRVSLLGVAGFVGVRGGVAGRGARELGSAAKSEGEKDGVGLGVGEVHGHVHVLVEEVFPVLGRSGGSVLFVLVDEFESEFFTADLGNLGGWLASADEVEVLVLVAHGPGPWILDHSGVWDDVIRNNADFSSGLSVVFNVGL